MVEYLIWSNDRGMWWKPGERGYTSLTHLAGRYSEADVERILSKCNETAELERPNEVACIVPWTTFGREEFEEANPPRSNFPNELTPELATVLGLMIMETCPVAHAFREAGRADIRKKVEAEQAYVLHWLVTLVLEHGANWGKHADETLRALKLEAAMRESKPAEEASRG